MKYKVIIKKFPETEERSSYRTNDFLAANYYISNALDNPLGNNYIAKKVDKPSAGFYAEVYENNEIFMYIQ